MKKIISVLMAAVIITGCVGVSAFTDVEADVSENSINRLSAIGILSGYPDGTFKPGEMLQEHSLQKLPL